MKLSNNTRRFLKTISSIIVLYILWCLGWWIWETPLNVPEETPEKTVKPQEGSVITYQGRKLQIPAQPDPIYKPQSRNRGQAHFSINKTLDLTIISR
ncbi:MAG: hypothetical protein OQJ89_05275 [Kangiellaceae bacterium]|nr:hypothetical protein [Kangiellaceae bacterium]MCW9016354.1 hypothetical protein [Kangiellaceae bacterium]